MSGRIVLDGEAEMEEGAHVTVWVGDSTDTVVVADEELRLIREGQANASAGKLVDARAFLRALRQAGELRGDEVIALTLTADPPVPQL